MQDQISTPNPGRELLLKVRAGLVSKDSSLNAWAISQGRREPNVRAALTGLWTGPTARKVIQQAMQAAGVEQ